MSERKVECHVSLHYVLPPEERDVWNAQDEDTKQSWQPLTGQQDEVGEPTEYAAAIPVDEIPRFEEARNCRYVVEAQQVHRHGDPEHVEELGVHAHVAQFPEPETTRYHRAEEFESNIKSGQGVVYFHLDTGVSNECLSALNAQNRVLGRRNFTNSGAVDDVSDPDGHGSMTISLLLPPAAQVYIFKVLGDDGSGASTWISAAIREAARIAKNNPGPKYILSGSLGGEPGRVFLPYKDACTAAEAAGVLCRWSAGNDGVHGVSAPANWREDRASIAFRRQVDRRAGFSNYAASCGSATEGEGVVVVDNRGMLARASGTSFSLPLWCRYTGIIASLRDKDVFTVNAAELGTGRDTLSSVDEEPHGVLDVSATQRKLGPTPPAAKPQPSTSRLMKSRIDNLSDDELVATHAEVFGQFGRRKLGVFRGVDV